MQSYYDCQISFLQNQDQSILQNKQISSICQEDKNNSKLLPNQHRDQQCQLPHLQLQKTDDGSHNQSKTIQRMLTHSLIPSALVKKNIDKLFSAISVYFFKSEKKMIFQKDQINRYFEKGFGNKQLKLKHLIPFLVKSYCKEAFNFQPIQINDQSFQLYLANSNNKKDQILDPYSPDLPVSYLYDTQNLILVRKQKSLQKINKWKSVYIDKPKMEIIEILLPDNKQFTLQFQNQKTIKHIKQHIFSSDKNNQLMGKVLLLTYNHFQLCENKLKIKDLDEKILQVYRQRTSEYVDKPQFLTQHTNERNYNNVQYYERLWKIQSLESVEENQADEEYYVSQSRLNGKLTLTLSKLHITQKHTGGMITAFPFNLFLYGYSSFNYNFTAHCNSQLAANSPNSYSEGGGSSVVILDNYKRIYTYSIHTLIGLLFSQNDSVVTLKFMYKDRSELKEYRFESDQNKEKFIKSILRIGRIYNKRWSKIL